ncbi:MAG: alpha-1,2-fucosyltransferase [bacterium]|jgi:hypothetical protein
MIISQIIGGLGNQLFQYATAKNLSLFLDQELYLDLNFFDTYHNPDVFRLDKYNVNFKIADQKDIDRLKRVQAKGIPAKIYRKIFKQPYYLNARNHFDQRWLLRNDWNQLKKHEDVYLSGYMANPYYFHKIENLIKKEFTLKDELNPVNKNMLRRIKSCESVMLHVRRGDYVNNDFFISQPVSYYLNAIEKITAKVTKPVFFVFSDDVEWTRKNIKADGEMIYCDINDGKTDYMELALMSACSHAIIANSTFSWWGAWLIDNPDKTVIAPLNWYSDPKSQAIYLKREVYQEGWQRL